MFQVCCKFLNSCLKDSKYSRLILGEMCIKCGTRNVVDTVRQDDIFRKNLDVLLFNFMTQSKHKD